MQRIVIVTDGSASAKHAVAVGLKLAAEHAADVTFVQDPRSEGAWRQRGRLKLLRSHRAAVESKRALAAAVEAAEKAGVSYKLVRRSITRQLKSLDEIVALADLADCELIIVGSRMRGADASALLRGVSNRMSPTSARDIF